jgi:UDP-2,3-diacylglucosamine pyrophosphatase LpxH
MSDLHISSPLFKKDREVIELFNDPKVESIYILGDLFDTWEEKVEKTVSKKKELINVINESGKTEVILKGNHDPDIEVMKDIFDKVFISDSYFTELFGKETILVHGDEFDGNEFWGKLLFPPAWLAERLLCWNSKAWLRNLIYRNLLWRKKAEHNSLVLKMEKMLVEKYGSEFDLIIAGHTHITKLVQEGKTYFANTGTLLHNPSYLIAEDNTMRIKRI